MTGGTAQSFFQIGTDQGFLNTPVSLTQLLLGPGVCMHVTPEGRARGTSESRP